MDTIDVTTEDMLNSRNAVLRDIKTKPNRARELESKFARHSALEQDYIETKASVCSVGRHAVDEKMLQLIPDKTSYPDLKQILDSQFYNAEVMNAVGCSVYANFYGAIPEKNNLSHIFHVKDAVTNLHRFGDESVSGYALTGELKDTKDMYVIKTPRTEDAILDLQHELFVGLFGTNSLRKYIPNFAYVYGGLKCSSPIVGKDGKVASWCDPHTKSKVPYVLYESISPSVSFKTFVQTCNVRDFHSYFCQFLLASDIANDSIGWTHYDSHHGNWLIRTVNVPGLSKEFSIPYSTKSGKTLYVSSKGIATAIDYGQATINYQGEDFGAPLLFLRAYGVKDGKFPLHDAYKLLMFLGGSALAARNVPVYRELEKLFHFFNKEESFEYAIKNQGPNQDLYYALPAFSDLVNLRMSDLLNYARKVWDLSKVLSEKPQHDILHCTSCYTFRGVLKETGTFADKPTAETFAQFYDLAIYLNSHSVDDYDDLVSRFDYKKAKKEFLSELDGLVQNIERLSGVVSNKQYTIATLPTNLAMREIANAHKTAFSLVADFEKADTMCKIGLSMSKLFHDKDLDRQCLNYRSILDKSKTGIGRQIDYLNDVYVVIHQLLSSGEWRNKYSKAFAWYETSSGDIVGLKMRFRQDISKLFTEMRLPSSIISHIAEEPQAPQVVQKQSPKKVKKAKVVIEEVKDEVPIVKRQQEEVKGIEIVPIRKRGLFPDNAKLQYQFNKKGQLERVDVA